MKTSLMILFSLILSLMAFGLCSAQQWTLGGRRKKIEQLLPTQSCYYEQVCVCVDISIFFLIGQLPTRHP